MSLRVAPRGWERLWAKDVWGQTELPHGDLVSMYRGEEFIRFDRVSQSWLKEEHEHLHRLPRVPHTLCFGQARKVDRQATVSVGEAIYSVPHGLIGERVWVRAEGEQLVVVHVDALQGPREVARPELTTPGRPSICDEHYPPRPAGPLERKPRARSAEEREFLAIGEGAEQWLKRAAAEGTQRIRRKMAEAVDLAKLHGAAHVD